MFREDVLFLIPALIVALVQVKLVWRKLPPANHQYTEIYGKYKEKDQLKFLYLMQSAYFIFFLQLVFPILEIARTYFSVKILPILGYIFILIGFFISLMALKTLGINWAGMHEYRIKTGQRLITTGVYGVVRHPIYFSVILEIVGFELVARSWLLIIFLIISLGIIYQHIKNEEELLYLKFGQSFLNYQRRVKMLIPYLF